jgi:hypothetical protein
VDAGAHIGFWTVPLPLEAASSGGRVLAAEPVPQKRSVEDLLVRFAHCRRIAVGVSGVSATPPGVDVLLSRDGPAGDRPDLSPGAARRRLPPRVAVVRSHAQDEYPNARHHGVHRLIDETLRRLDAAVVEFDTRVGPRNLVGRSTSKRFSRA